MADRGVNARAFAVIAPSLAGGVLVLALLLLAIAGVGISFGLEATTGLDVLLKLAPVLVVMAVLAPFLLVALRRHSVSLEPDILVVKAGLYTHRVAVAALDLDHARIVDLAERTELRPRGSSLPGFKAGWFRRRDGLQKGFYLLTSTRNVLWLPQRDGVSLLLSLQQPMQLLSALRDVAKPDNAR